MAPHDPSHDSGPTDAELEAIRASEPDPMGLMDVIELIAPEARVTGWHRLTGGLATALHRIDVAMPSGATTGFVLRRYLPERGDDGEVATREALVLEALRGTLVPAPEVLWLDADGTVFDRPAIAMTEVPGGTRTDALATDPAVVTGLAEALVSLRWVPLDELEGLPTLPDAASLVAPLRDGLVELPASDLVDTAAVVAALVAHADRVTARPVGLSHGDFHAGNVLFDGARASGIVDWDAARLADPRADVVTCALDLALVAGDEVAEAFLAAHAALRGELADAAWWRLWAASRLLPDPGQLLPAWRAQGVELDEAVVADRYVAWVEAALVDLEG